MAKVLYWHLKPDDVADKEYPVDKLIHWEIRSYFDEQSYASIYWFKNGVPFDKEPINGLAMYGYELDEKIIDDIKEFINKEFGGNVLRRSHRIFFDGSKVIKDNRSIAELAKRLDDRFRCISEIWLEFEDIEEEFAKKLFKKPLIIEK
ncbi:MAG: hypothetical protein KatS3mg003_1031 [Candidatus Nitrosocaldaceae archaeon]|nr:MAG: hypothetical protein KatS3mg003_1031 [Candidatus Nitrosocaldaceae archaeon]